MDYYFTSICLLGLKDQNLPPFKEARLKRFQSIKKMIDLVKVAKSLAPSFPAECLMLNPFDAEWDDDMTIPSIQYSRFLVHGMGFGLNLFLYAYNYNVYTSNIRFRNMRYFFPIMSVGLFASMYWEYKKQLTQTQLFDEYVQLRAQELVKENEYILEHEDFKKFIWWNEDFKETLSKVYRQANNHDSSDFADSEVVLQDFIKRYSDPTKRVPYDPSNKMRMFV